MQEQMNYDRTARVGLDRDLTEMTRRYRELALENIKIKEENLQLRNYVDNRYSTLLSEVKAENQIIKAQADDLAGQIVKLQNDTKGLGKEFLTLCVLNFL